MLTQLMTGDIENRAKQIISAVLGYRWNMEIMSSHGYTALKYLVSKIQP